MARFSGATVLLILVATVSVYTCAILAGAALGRALDSPGRTTMTKQPWARDVALRFRVSFRGLAEDLAKELWGGNHGEEEGRSSGGARPGHAYRLVEAPDAARVSQRHTRAKLEYQQRQLMRVIQAELEYQRCHHMVAQRAATRSIRETSRKDGVYEGGATAMPVSSDSDAELRGGGYHGEEGRSGGRAHAGDRAAAIEYQRCHRMLEQRAATRARRESSRSDDGVYEAGAAAATAVPVSSETELWRGYDREEGRSGGRAHAGAGDRAAAEALPSSASVPLSPAELQDRQRQRREEGRPGAGAAASLSPADRQRAMRQIDRMRIEMWRRGMLSNFSGAITDWARPGEGAGGGVVKVGPWGGPGGQAFYMPPGEEGAPRLLSITLYHADAVHALSFEYLLGGVGVGRTMGPSGGGRSRGLRETINFAPDEHLTAVEGTFGRCTSLPAEVVVTSLTFRTDKGRTYGPYGEETGTPFSVPAADGCIIGFWGRSGWLLDAIGVYIMPTCQVNDPTSFVTNAYNYKATS